MPDVRPPLALAVGVLAEWMDPRKDVADLLTKHELPPDRRRGAPRPARGLWPVAASETLADAGAAGSATTGRRPPTGRGGLEAALLDQLGHRYQRQIADALGVRALRQGSAPRPRLHQPPASGSESWPQLADTSGALAEMGSQRYCPGTLVCSTRNEFIGG